MKFLVFIAIFQTSYGIPGRITIPTGKIAVLYTNKKLVNETFHGPVLYFDPIFSEAQLVDVESQKDFVGKFECIALDDQVVTFHKIEITNQLPQSAVIKVLSKFEKFYDSPPLAYDKPLIIDEAISFMKELCNQMTGEELRKDKYSTLNERLLEHLSSFQKN